MVSCRSLVLFALMLSACVLASPVANGAKVTGGEIILRDGANSGVTSDACANAGGWAQQSCCDPMQTNSDSAAGESLLGGLIGALLGLGVDVALVCSPVSVLISPSSVDCNLQTVCCNEVNPSGLINLTCVPLNVNL
ncbi:hypothetical protein FISHEDRAFT_56988 [Fistulina hepatica ATCC 64428]|nr:hypothetical protein FISHEDRAFT_56988 [Fistulina hepatica ATCC 64428]